MKTKQIGTVDQWSEVVEQLETAVKRRDEAAFINLISIPVGYFRPPHHSVYRCFEEIGEEAACDWMRVLVADLPPNNY